MIVIGFVRGEMFFGKESFCWSFGREDIVSLGILIKLASVLSSDINE